MSLAPYQSQTFCIDIILMAQMRKTPLEFLYDIYVKNKNDCTLMGLLDGKEH